MYFHRHTITIKKKVSYRHIGPPQISRENSSTHLAPFYGSPHFGQHFNGRAVPEEVTRSPSVKSSLVRSTVAAAATTESAMWLDHLRIKFDSPFVSFHIPSADLRQQARMIFLLKLVKSNSWLHLTAAQSDRERRKRIIDDDHLATPPTATTTTAMSTPEKKRC